MFEDTGGYRRNRTCATSCSHGSLVQLPPEADLRAHMPPVYDQGQLGSCTANAIGGAMEYERTRQGESDFMPSRLFIYYNERVVEGTTSSDSGAQIRDGIKVVNTEGVCAGVQLALRHHEVRRPPVARLLHVSPHRSGAAVRGDPDAGRPQGCACVEPGRRVRVHGL